jgi:hypothetical protein
MDLDTLPLKLGIHSSCRLHLDLDTNDTSVSIGSAAGLRRFSESWSRRRDGRVNVSKILHGRA